MAALRIIPAVLLLASVAALRVAPRSPCVSRRALSGAAIGAASQLPLGAFGATGLSWEDVKVGGGDKIAVKGDTVTIDYVAWLGGFGQKEFSRFEKPIKVTLGEGKIVAGLEAALSDGMRAGGTRRVVIPPDFAYGATGLPRSGEKRGTIIPPNATLYFEVRLRTIVLSKGFGFGFNVA